MLGSMVEFTITRLFWPDRIQPKCETVSPQLSLGAKTVWRLQHEEQRCANRPDHRNLARQFHGYMFAVLDQQIASCCVTQRLLRIQLLIVPLGPEANSRLYDLAQPFRTNCKPSFLPSSPNK